MGNISNLDLMDGLVFATDRDGVIVDIGESNWNAFTNENGAPELQAKSVIGKNLFDFIKGEQVRDQFRKVLDRISDNPNWSWVLPYRCDSPDRERTMCQSLRPIFAHDRCTGYIFQSVEQSSRLRPPIPLYNFRFIEQMVKENGNLPLVMMCSWCQRVQSEEICGSDWISAEDYYVNGGRTNVRLSHGICENCIETTSDPFLIENVPEAGSD